MISTFAMAALLSAWFYRIMQVAMTGVITPIPPMTMLALAIICSAVFARKITRGLS